MTAAPPHAATGDDDQTTDALLSILRLSRILERVDAGVSPQQYRILMFIGEGGERSARLAERLAVARPTLTATADGLVAAGLAYREPEPGDRRVVRLRLTPAGQAALERADRAYRDWFGELLEQTGRRDQIISGLLALDASLDERRRSRLAAGGSPPGQAPPAQSEAGQPSAGQLTKARR